VLVRRTLRVRGSVGGCECDVLLLASCAFAPSLMVRLRLFVSLVIRPVVVCVLHLHRQEAKALLIQIHPNNISVVPIRV